MDKNNDTLDPWDPSASKLGKMGCENDSPTRGQVVNSSHSPFRVIHDFTDTISIRVKDKYFNVPRDLLTGHSTFFDEELNHCEPKKFFLVLDDIDADVFNVFISMLLESSFPTEFKMRSRHDPPHGPSCKFLLRLWKLSHRFSSRSLRLLVEEALRTQHFDKITPHGWEMLYVNKTEARVRQYLLALQECYTFCKNELIPFEQEFVIACAKCPGQVVATYFDHLDPGFRAEAVKSFAIRVADPSVAQRKRDLEDESEPKGLKKRRS